MLSFVKTEIQKHIECLITSYNVYMVKIDLGVFYEVFVFHKILKHVILNLNS